MIVVVNILFKKIRIKQTQRKKRLKRQNARLEAIEQRLEDSSNQNREPSKESNLKPTATAKKVVADEKKPQMLEELE